MRSKQTPAMTPEECEAWLRAPGGQLAQMMRLLAKPEHADVYNEVFKKGFQQTFIRDVGAKAARWRDNLTEKQRNLAIDLMTTPEVLTALCLILDDEEEEQDHPTVTSSISEPAKPRIDETLDPKWGIF